MTKTARVRVYLACSLDGYIAGPNNDLDWLQGHGTPEEFESSNAISFEQMMSETGAMLMGRTTFDVVQSFGPDAWAYGETPVLVATTRPLESELETVKAIAGDIETLIGAAKERAGEKDVYLDGGALVRHALEAGLVDEFILTIVPMILGDGVRLFSDVVPRRQLTFTAHETMGQMVQLVATVNQ